MTDLQPSQSLNLEAFERLVFLRDGSQESFEAIFNQFFEIMTQVRVGSGFLGASDDAERTSYTRLAGAITAFLTDQRYGLSQEGFVRMCANHAQIHAIFRASAYETMDNILGTLGTRDPARPDQMNFAGDQTIMRLLICWSLDSDVDIDFAALAQAQPELAAQAVIGMLSVGGSHTRKSYDRRLMLMRQKELIGAVALHPQLIQSAGDCYMHCSYTDAPDKHEIKRVLNERMRDIVSKSFSVEECTRGSVRKERPTIVIPIEWFGAHHAMYRCYAPSVLQLREKFRVVAIFRDNSEVDEEGQKVFDKAVKLGADRASIQSIHEAILAEDPDIIYYPSLGMAAWYVCLSNFRLAPIQVISPGHPASSMSRMIDYIVSDGDLFGAASDYTEKLVPLPQGTVRYIERADLLLPNVVRKDDGKVRIAVPAMATKIIPPFLEALKRVQADSKRPIEYHFFPNMTGLSHTVITKDLRRMFPDCVVRHRHTYEQYLAWVAECDFMASTFPFGGTNSTIDSFLLGLPVVTLEGPHVHGRSDASMMRRVGLPEWCITHTVDEYVTACVRMVDSEFQRQALRELLKAKDIHGEFYGDGPAEFRGGFLRAFEMIYEQELEKHGQETGTAESARASA